MLHEPTFGSVMSNGNLLAVFIGAVPFSSCPVSHSRNKKVPFLKTDQMIICYLFFFVHAVEVHLRPVPPPVTDGVACVGLAGHIKVTEIPTNHRPLPRGAGEIV